jgi:hypothetical protein
MRPPLIGMLFSKPPTHRTTKRGNDSYSQVYRLGGSTAGPFSGQLSRLLTRAAVLEERRDWLIIDYCASMQARSGLFASKTLVFADEIILVAHELDEHSVRQ